MAKNKKEKTNKEKTGKPLSIQDIITSKYGEGSIFKIRDEDVSGKLNPAKFFSTGSRCINDAVTGDSKCGIPRGHITEMYGPEGAGKSTMALHIAAEANKVGEKCGYLDMEHAMNLRYAVKVGVDPELFFLCQPFCAEEAFDMAEDLIKQGVKLLIFDSVDAMVPRAILEGTMDEQHMGNHARVMGKGVRKQTGMLKRENAAALYINQIRMKIGGYGNPETTTGGLALKFYSFVRLEIRAPRGGKIMQGKGSLDDIETEDGEEKGGVEKGTQLNIKVVKNKLFPPFRKCSVNLVYGSGIDKDDDMLRFLESRNIISMPSKAFVVYPINASKKMKREKFLEKLEDKEVKKHIREALSK